LLRHSHSPLPLRRLADTNRRERLKQRTLNRQSRSASRASGARGREPMTKQPS
jgi:hypothetical protein